jgi:glucose-1-phosphate thymidylyltransferase
VIRLYFNENQVIEIAHSIRSSSRTELEIIDINRFYLERKEFTVNRLDRGSAWLKTGTNETTSLEAAQYIETLGRRQELNIAWREGWISSEDLQEQV